MDQEQFDKEFLATRLRNAYREMEACRGKKKLDEADIDQIQGEICECMTDAGMSEDEITAAIN